MKNTEILDQLYRNGRTDLKQEELINAGFDFSEFYFDKEGKQLYDKEDLAFPFKDFICGKYFIKTIGDLGNGLSPSEKLKFRIIRIDFSELRSVIERAIELRRNRKYWNGEAWARTNDSQMSDERMASSFNQKVTSNEANIQLHCSMLSETISSMESTIRYLKEIESKMNDANEDGEYWL